MLGSLLEFSIRTRPVPAALEAFNALGLAYVPASEIAPSSYAVVSGDDVSIGMYGPGATAEDDEEHDSGAIMPTFVRPDLKNHVRALRRRGVEFDFVELAEDEFHRVGFRDPSGCLVHLIEARTFPPAPADANAIAICGRLVELSLASSWLDDALSFWRGLGLDETGEPGTPHRAIRLRGHGLTLGLHETTRFGTALTFRADNLGARVEYLRAKGFDVRPGSPMTNGDDSATLHAPGGVRFFLLDEQAPAAEPSAADF